MRVRNRSRFFSRSYRTLEPRRLLAGDVQVVLSNQILHFIGDGQSNQIEVAQQEDGSLLISGDETTINGVDEAFVFGQSYGLMSFFMNAGDDEVALDGVQVDRNLSFFGAEGNDRFRTSSTSAYHLHADGGVGNDVFEIEMFTRQSAYFYLGDGDDVLALNSFTAGRNFKVFAGSGDDTVATDRLFVNRKLEVNLEEGSDSAVFAGDTTARLHAKIDAGDGNDFVAFDPGESESLRFDDFLKVELGSGDDNLLVAENISVRHLAKFFGGDGDDSIEQLSDLDETTSGFEFDSITAPQSLLDAVFETLENTSIDPGPFGGDAFEQENLALTLSEDGLTFTEGDGAIAVDAGLTLTGSASANIQEASITIDDFVTGEDELAFDGANGILWDFDTENGVLTLSGEAPIDDYQSALQAVVYQNESANPTAGDRLLRFEITSDDEVVIGSRSLTIIPENTAPSITLSRDTVSATEFPIVLDPLLEVSDPDSAQLTQAIVQVTEGFVSGEDELLFDLESGINATFDQSTGTITASGSAVAAGYQAFLRSIRFSPADLQTSSRTIRISIGDGEATASSDLSVNPA